MAQKLIRCVQINGNRVKFLPEAIARNPNRLKQINYMIQEIDELITEPEKPFPTPDTIVEPKKRVDGITLTHAVIDEGIKPKEDVKSIKAHLEDVFKNAPTPKKGQKQIDRGITIVKQEVKPKSEPNAKAKTSPKQAKTKTK